MWKFFLDSTFYYYTHFMKKNMNEYVDGNIIVLYRQHYIDTSTKKRVMR